MVARLNVTRNAQDRVRWRLGITHSLLLSRRARVKSQNAKLPPSLLLALRNLLALDQEKHPFPLLVLVQGKHQFLLLALDQDQFLLQALDLDQHLLQALDQGLSLQLEKECNVPADVTVQMEVHNVNVTATVQ